MSSPTRGVLAGVRVLLIDDDEDTRELFTVVLAGAGARVIAVESAGRALERFNRETFDVIVSDAGLPGQDGWSLIETIRRMRPERGGLIRAVAVTARAFPADVAHSLASGFQAHLSKPVDLEVLVATVAELAGRDGASTP